jgi:hypothetical protein
MIENTVLYVVDYVAGQLLAHDQRCCDVTEPSVKFDRRSNYWYVRRVFTHDIPEMQEAWEEAMKIGKAKVDYLKNNNWPPPQWVDDLQKEYLAVLERGEFVGVYEVDRDDPIMRTGNVIDQIPGRKVTEGLERICEATWWKNV